MAMTNCVECGREISTKAEACVGCGAPVPVRWSAPTPTTRVTADRIAGLLLLVLLIAAYLQLPS